MRKRSRAALLSMLALSAQAGCAYTGAFNRSPYIDQAALGEFLGERGPRKPGEIAFLKSPPARPYVVLGTIDAPNVEWTAHYDQDDLISAMRAKAAEIGADAILDFRTQHNPTIHSVGSVSRTQGGIVTAVTYKGLHAWGEAILYVPAERKTKIEPQ